MFTIVVVCLDRVVDRYLRETHYSHMRNMAVVESGHPNFRVYYTVTLCTPVPETIITILAEPLLNVRFYTTRR
jgi:hypothetical protein